MSSLDSLLSRQAAAQGVIGQVTTDTPVVIRLRPKAAAGAITSVTTTTATAIVAISANGGTETWDFATYTTIGTLADKINASSYWECRILDSLRTDASASVLVTGAISSSVTDGVTYWDALADTSAGLHFSYRLANDRSVGVNTPKGSHRVHLLEIQYLLDVGTAAMDNYQIWEIDGGVETQIWKGLNVDNTATTDNWASGIGKITSKEGNELLIRIKDAATLANSTSNYLTVIGQRE